SPFLYSAHVPNLADASIPCLHKLVGFPVAEPVPDKSDRHVHNSDVPDLNSNVLHVSVGHQSAQSINHVVQPSPDHVSPDPDVSTSRSPTPLSPKTVPARTTYLLQNIIFVLQMNPFILNVNLKKAPRLCFLFFKSGFCSFTIELFQTLCHCDHGEARSYHHGRAITTTAQ